MAGDEQLTIGRFARISGLSTHALRHYDDIGLLKPVEVDPATGYRLYRREQVRSARLIQALRWIELPLEEIRAVLDDPDASAARRVLEQHRERLSRQQRQVADQIANVDHYLEKGISMSPVTGTRPVQLKIAVDDVDAAITFYQKAFGFQWDVTRRTDDAEYSSFMFSKYGENDFFLLHLLGPDRVDTDRPGPATFGLLVEDLDESHARAVAAGATEVSPIQDPQGMPRCSAVKDPDGNWVWLYQG